MYAKVRREFPHRHHAGQVVFWFCHVLSPMRVVVYFRWRQTITAESLISYCCTKPHLITTNVAKSTNAGQEEIVWSQQILQQSYFSQPPCHSRPFSSVTLNQFIDMFSP